jgi:predicted XRE-type DNA-binding protein
MKTSQKIEVFIRNKGVKKGWIAQQLGISRPTFNERMRDNCFKIDEIIKLKSIGIE